MDENERVQWHRLPAALRRVVEDRTGPVARAEAVPEGLNCSVALLLDTERGGPLFLKGVRTSDTDEHAALLREQRTAPLVSGLGVSPSIRYRFEAAGWHCLAFDRVDGRHADLSPESGDLAAVAAALRRARDVPPPANAPLPALAERYAGFLMPGEAEALAGPHLLHTDTNPHNFLIDAATGAAYLVDWAMPALGPAWVDAAYTAVRLMECGHGPREARAWLDGFTFWREADAKAVEVFVGVVCRHWTAAVGERGSARSNDRFRALLPR